MRVGTQLQQELRDEEQLRRQADELAISTTTNLLRYNLQFHRLKKGI